MEWIEVRISTSSEGVEPVFGVLLTNGINGVEIIDNYDMKQFLQGNPFNWDYVDEALLSASESEAVVRFYVTPDETGRDKIAKIKNDLSALLQASVGLPLGALTVDGMIVDDTNWLNEWKKFFKPFRIGKSVIVTPVWEVSAASNEDVVFTIDPGSVFGTGLHPSTRMCVEALECYIKPSNNVLDMGSGSGILSIISLLMGADFALACDYEPAAAVSAKQNAELNRISTERYEVITGDIFNDEALQNSIRRKRYDIVFANIVADVIIRLLPVIPDYLMPGGIFIASGIIDERAADVRTALSQLPLTILDTLEQDGWCCLVCTISI